MEQRDNVFANAPFGYAYHKIIVDENGRPVDYRFIEVNKTFKKLTGLENCPVSGKKVSELLPELTAEPFDWIAFYGKVALEETQEVFEQYSESLDRYFNVQAYAPQKGFFVTVFTDITEKKKTEQILNAYASLINQSRDIMVVKDLNLRVVATNNAFAEAAGCQSAADLLGKTDAEIFGVTEETEPVKSYMADERRAQTLPPGEFILREEPVLRPDGTTRWVLTKKYPIYKENDLIGTGNISVDITDRVQTKNRMIENDQKIQTIFDESPVALLIHDKNNGEIIDANKNGYKLYECNSLEELQKMDFWQDPEFSREQALEKIRQTLQTGLETFEWRHIKKNNTVIWEKVTLTKITLNNRIRILATIVDITPQKKAEFEIRKQQKQFQLLFEESPLGIYIADPAGNILNANKKLLKLLGSPSLEATKQINVLTFPLLVKNGYAEIFKKSVAEKQTIRFELDYTSKWGLRRTYSTYITPLLDSENKVTSVYTLMEDITRQRQNEADMRAASVSAQQAKKQAEAASKAKSEFLANMSHEIRTPMNSVIGFSELLQDTPLNKTQKQYADNIYSSGKGLLNIINDILDFSKIEAGKLELELLKVDLIELLKQTVDMFKFSIEKKGLELLVNIDPALPRFALLDPGRFRQILANLLSNAVKFTKQGEIELKAVLKKRDGQCACLEFSIRDTGIGISPEQREKLFQPFSQADSSTTRKYGGTGLGLIISQQLAQMMGTELQITSVPQRGSTFFFLLETQVADRAEPVCGPTKSAPSSIIKEPHTVLIAEDDPVNMLLAKKRIKKVIPEANIIEAVNGAEAVDKIIEHSPELVFMDVQMPVLDGNDAVKQLRKIEKKYGKRRTIVIGLTAGALEQERKTALASGMDEFLTKPIVTDKLNSVLKKYLE